MTSGRHPIVYRERLKLWLKDIMERNHWTAEYWARQANISGTTITRFLNTDDPQRTPSAATVEKLARAARVPAPHEVTNVTIAIIRRNRLLEEAARRLPANLDLFAMPSIETIPAPQQYAGCVAVELDNGDLGLLRPADPADLRSGQLALVLRNLNSLGAYYVDQRLLIPTDTSRGWTGALPITDDDPNIQVLGVMAGKFVNLEG